MIRIWIEKRGARNEAIEFLEDNFVDFDMDNGDRILVDEENFENAKEALEDCEIDYDII